MNPWPVLRDSWFFFSRNLATIIALCMPVIVLNSAAQYALAVNIGPDASPAYSTVIDLMFYPLYTAALIIFLAARSNGEHPKVADVLAVAVTMWPRFAVLAALTYVLTVLGLSLMLLPGIFLLVKLAFSEYLLVLRRLTPLAAIRDSFAMTNGHFSRILICGACVSIPLIAVKVSFSAAIGEDYGLQFLLDCMSGVFDLLGTVVMFRLFMLISSEPA